MTIKIPSEITALYKCGKTDWETSKCAWNFKLGKEKAMNEKHIRLQFVCWHPLSWQNPEFLVDFTRTFGFPAFSRNSVNLRVAKRKWDSRIWPVCRSYRVRVLSSRRTNSEGLRLLHFKSGLPLSSLMDPSQISCKDKTIVLDESGLPTVRKNA